MTLRKRLIWLAAVGLMLVQLQAARAEDPPAPSSPGAQASPALTPAKSCDVQYREATTKLFACMAGLMDTLKAQLASLIPELGVICGPDMENAPWSCGLQLEVANQIGRAQQTGDFSFFWDDMNTLMAGCISQFDASYQAIGKSCGQVAGNSTFCAARKYAAAVCNTYCQGNCAQTCSRRIKPPDKCSSPTAKIRVKCDYLPTELLAGCIAGSRVSASSPPNADPARSSKSPERKTSASAKTAGVPPAKKNNLDRFDLGPTFVSPDTSSGVSRTARSAGSSKTQAKTTGTSDAKIPKTSSAPMAVGGGIQGTVKTTGTSDASKPPKTLKSLDAPLVGGGTQASTPPKTLKPLKTLDAPIVDNVKEPIK